MYYIIIIHIFGFISKQGKRNFLQLILLWVTVKSRVSIDRMYEKFEKRIASDSTIIIRYYKSNLFIILIHIMYNTYNVFQRSQKQCDIIIRP